MRKRQQTSTVPETPYLAARREWNERYSDYIKSAHTWRLTAFGALAIAALSTGGLIAVSMQTSVVPYAVELNGHNEVVQVRRADVLAQPNANQIRASMRNWIIGARSVYTDGAAMKNLIDETYALTLPDSAAFQELAVYHRANNPYRRAAQEAVAVDVQAIVPVSADTWQVEWRETRKQASGKVLSVEDWQGNFTVLIAPPLNEAQIMVNPLGLYVRQFAWTRRLPGTR